MAGRTPNNEYTSRRDRRQGAPETTFREAEYIDRLSKSRTPDAAPREEQKYFLATQQVDEARHAVFFKRFMHEVVGRGDGSVAGGLEATRGELTWGADLQGGEPYLYEDPASAHGRSRETKG